MWAGEVILILWRLQVFGKLINLGFVQVRQRLYIHAAVAPLDKEALVMLVLGGSTDDGQIAQFGVVIEHRHAAALFEVRWRPICLASLAEPPFALLITSGLMITISVKKLRFLS
ncbi:MAG: hypothetical protein M5U34_08995 [Chloroflexi bacterium]|nr:hypothetical protein [Chloroflexota bacterium]